jgi:hypothetical protein
MRIKKESQRFVGEISKKIINMEVKKEMEDNTRKKNQLP